MTGSNEEHPGGRLRWWMSVAYALFIHALFAVLAIIGVLVVHAMYRAWRTGEAGVGEAVGFGLFGLLLAVIGAGFFYVAYVGAPRFLGGLERTRQKYKDRPWLIDRQWRARRVVHSTKYTAWFMWFWCACWWGILGFLWSVNKDLIIADLKGPWSQAIPSSIPFVAGIIGLLVACALTWRRWRYGDAVLLISTLPGYLGENFRGQVQAQIKARLNEPLTLTLSCGALTSERVSTSDGRYETVWVTEELWAARQQLRPAQTTFSRGRASIPVDFDLPPDQPESGHVLDDPQIVWKLEVDPGSVLDRAIKCEFRVPIFSRRNREHPDTGGSGSA